jgi:hypothetical protein
LTYSTRNDSHNTALPADRFRGDHNADRQEPPGDPDADSTTGPRYHGRGGGRIMALAAISVLLGGSLLAGRASAAETAPAQAAQGQGCILLIICPPSQSPSPSPPTAPSSPAPGGGTGGTGTAPSSPGAGIIGGLLPGATPGAGSGNGKGGAANQNGKKGKQPANKKANRTAGLIVCTSPTVLTAESATMNGLAYQGVVNMPTAGGTVQMMKFTLTSQSLTSATQTVTELGRTLTTKLMTATFSGNVVLYATKLSGNLGAIPLTLTPGNVVSTLLQLLNTLTPKIPVRLTKVTADQPVLLAGSTVIHGLDVSAG